MPFPSTTRYFTVPAGGFTDTIAAQDPVSVVYIDGTVVLAAGYTLSVTGTPGKGDRLLVEWDAVVTVGAFGVTILGLALTAQQALKNLTLTCIYDGAAWKVDVHPDFNQAEIVSDNNIISGSATTGISLAKMRDLARGSQIVGNATNRPTALDQSGAGHLAIGDGHDIVANAMSGDGTLASTGVMTIAAGVVTNAKLADMAANTVKVRNANSSGVPSDIALATTQLLIGDGTGFTAASLSGDATMTNAGAVTVLTIETMTVYLDFTAAGFIGDYIIRMPDACDVTHLRVAINGATLPITDDITVTPKDDAGITMKLGAVNAVATIAAGAGLNATTDQVIDTDNSFTTGQTMTLTTAKTTPIAALSATATITYTRT